MQLLADYTTSNTPCQHNLFLLPLTLPSQAEGQSATVGRNWANFQQFPFPHLPSSLLHFSVCHHSFSLASPPPPLPLHMSTLGVMHGKDWHVLTCKGMTRCIAGANTSAHSAHASPPDSYSHHHHHQQWSSFCHSCGCATAVVGDLGVAAAWRPRSQAFCGKHQLHTNTHVSISHTHNAGAAHGKHLLYQLQRVA